MIHDLYFFMNLSSVFHFLNLSPFPSTYIYSLRAFSSAHWNHDVYQLICSGYCLMCLNNMEASWFFCVWLSNQSTEWLYFITRNDWFPEKWYYPILPFHVYTLVLKMYCIFIAPTLIYFLHNHASFYPLSLEKMFCSIANLC